MNTSSRCLLFSFFKRGLLLSLVLLLNVIETQGASSSFGIQNLNANKGLSNNYVTSIAQDSRGFLYIGTQSGFNRFDGHTFTHYKSTNTGMAGDNVTALLYEEVNDRLWVGTKSGLYVFRLPQMTLEEIAYPKDAKTYNINDLKRASDGGIWIANHFESVTHYDPASGKFTVYSTRNVKGMPYDILTAVDDGRGNLYVGHYKDGVSVIDMKTRKLRNLRHDPADPQSLPGDRVRTIFRDSFNNLWFATSDGLALKNPASDSFKVFRHTASAGSLAGNAVYALMETPSGDLWVGSDIGGISIAPIRLMTESDGSGFTGFCTISDSNDGHGTASKNIRALFLDSFGNIWIGNFSSGLDFIPHHRLPFERLPWLEFVGNGAKYKSAWSVAVDRNGEIWIGGESEVAHFRDGEFVNSIDLTGHITRYHDRVEHLVPVDGRILIGLDNNGVLELTPETGAVRRLPMPDIADGAMNSFTAINDSIVLIASENGIYVYRGGRIERPENINKDLRWISVNSIIVDRTGNLWVGTNGSGIRVYDRRARRIRTLDKSTGFPSNVVNHLMLDSRGNIWAATGNGVALIRDSASGSGIRTFNVADGMGDKTACAIAEDRSGDIWIATGNSISKWNRQKDMLELYDQRMGVPMSSFMSRAITVAPDSSLYFGSLDGVWRVDPKDVEKMPKLAPVVISDFAWLGDSEEVEGFVYKLKDDGTVMIPHDRNSFRISFSVPDYSESHAIDYFYMMEGVDKEWHSTNGQSSVTFRNLPAGTYTFKVKARFYNGDDESVAELKIRILPPLLLRWYFIVLYVVLLLFLLWLILRRHELHIKKDASVKSQLEITKNKQRLNEERLRFYTDISHELRTPLTLILGPSEDLKHAPDIPEKYSAKIDLINYNARNLLMLISQMLELHKTETASRRLSVRKDDISALVTETALRFKEYNRNENVKLSLDIDRSVPPIYFDRKIISSILNNLVSNALKYTKIGGVTVGIRKSGEDDLEIFVADTGIGISEKDLPHLFERFYRVDENSSVVGTGIGLSLSKTLADLHHASLTVESELDRGSVFRLRLSISETYPDALHKDEPVRPETAKEDAGESSRVKLPVMLVVEDNADIRDYVKEAFRDRFRVETASDGEEGLEKARAVMPDIIISDIMMPKMNGVEMCRRLKADFATSHIPVVLLTAKDSIEDKEEGYAAGAVSYITKPFSARLLIARVDNIIEASRKLAVRFSREGMAVAPEVVEAEDIPQDKVEEDQEIRPQLSKLDREFLSKLREIVLENISNPKFGMPLIAERFNMSNSTLYRKISVLTGTTAVKHIRNIRLQRTCELLDEGYTVSEAAFACGFNDLAYYRSCFKEDFGMSPSMYKKRGQK